MRLESTIYSIRLCDIRRSKEVKKMRKGKKKSFLALLLCMLLTFSSAISAFAAEADGVDPAAETTIGSEEAENFMGGVKTTINL